MRTELGKIAKAEFGYGGYQEIMFGLSLTFEGQNWGVGTFIGEWSLDIEADEHKKWTEEDRSRAFDKAMRKLNETLHLAKVQYVSQLKGIPVEVTFDGNVLSDWRILTEVL
jgi:hypothetical protein